MKVGTDGVLLASWTKLEDASKILDVGTGCGLIPLIITQRKKNAKVLGLDIDDKSIAEAKVNFSHSPFGDRLFAFTKDFNLLNWENSFDKIISNPPFFNLKLENKEYTKREKARHQIALTIPDLIAKSYKLLKQNGELDFIFPFQDFNDDLIENTGFVLIRKYSVIGMPDKKPKRMLICLRKSTEKITLEEGEIVLEQKRGERHPTYDCLSSSFYL